MTPKHASRLELHSPILKPEEMEAIKAMSFRGWETKVGSGGSAVGKQASSQEGCLLGGVENPSLPSYQRPCQEPPHNTCRRSTARQPPHAAHNPSTACTTGH